MKNRRQSFREKVLIMSTGNTKENVIKVVDAAGKHIRKYLKREIEIFGRKLENFLNLLSMNTIDSFMVGIICLKGLKDNLE